ncbi:MAG: hypothetical protein KGO51_14745 [Alphaproteobacteria bacterium]|nr:hypothetical protein [Alphaproteobacteria bacterium]
MEDERQDRERAQARGGQDGVHPVRPRRVRSEGHGALVGWRMPPLERLAPVRMSAGEKLWMGVLRGYLVLSGGLVLVRIVQLALGGHG